MLNSQSQFFKHHFEFPIHQKLIPKLAYPIIAELVSLLVLLYIVFNTVTVEDGSEIFYQVDRSAFTAGLNGAANPRSIPDIINSSSGTLSEYLYLSCVVAISAQPMILTITDVFSVTQDIIGYLVT